jgi:hypothetical protein
VLDEIPQARRQLLMELREVNHWRRLVAARLDLAVAAVADLAEPASRDLPCTPELPSDLRTLVGLGHDSDDRCAQAAVLERLRAVLDDLDAYALALRALAVTAT